MIRKGRTGTAKPVLLAAAMVFFAGFAFAAGPGQDSWWYTLERGKLMFSQGDYGNALLTFEDARRDRFAMYERMEQNLIELLSASEFRRMGDSLDWVEKNIREGYFDDAQETLDELFFRVPKDSLDNSVAAALEALGNLKYFPEAQMWTGKTFLASGEQTMALRQFELALSRRELFEDQSQICDLLYEIAEVHRINGEFTEMEKVLLSILEDSSLWTEGDGGWQAGTFARDAMTRTLQRDGAERFLRLYRYGNTRVLRAHQELGLYYASLGRHAKAQEHFMFAFIIQNTVIIDEILRGNYDFEFTTLEALSAQIQQSRFLSEYAGSSQYSRTVFFLGNSLFGNGYTAPARQLWSFLASNPGAGEWQIRAASQLRTPQVEPTVAIQ